MDRISCTLGMLSIVHIVNILFHQGSTQLLMSKYVAMEKSDVTKHPLSLSRLTFGQGHSFHRVIIEYDLVFVIVNIEAVGW